MQWGLISRETAKKSPQLLLPDAFLPSDLEDVLASLVAVDSHELFLPSQQPPLDEAAAAAKHVAAHDLQQVKTAKGHCYSTIILRCARVSNESLAKRNYCIIQKQQETPILSGPTPEPPVKKVRCHDVDISILLPFLPFSVLNDRRSDYSSQHLRVIKK